MQTNSQTQARQVRTIRIIAAFIIIGTLFGLPLLIAISGNQPATAEAVENPSPSECNYAITPEESGLTPTIYVDLQDGKSMDLTFGELTKFHAECQKGKIRYWVLTIDHLCIRETIELDSRGTWSCILNLDGNEGWGFRMGGLWAYPQGLPENGWIETNPLPLMVPVPEGSVDA